jgi:hypothetical protein
MNVQRYHDRVQWLSDHLPALRQDYPNYSFGIARTHCGVGLVAVRTDDGPGPYMVITADVTELRACLAESYARP